MATTRFIDTCGQPAKKARLDENAVVVKEWVDELMPFDWAYHRAIERIEDDDICIKVLDSLLSKEYSDINEKGHFFGDRDEPQRTPLWTAAAQGRPRVVAWLVHHGARSEIHNSLDYETPLFVAAKNGHLDSVRVLARSGANVNFESIHHITPLFTAVVRRRLDVVKWLVEEGKADLDIAESIDGRTPLFMACQYGELDYARILVKNGADVNKANKTGTTPLYIAAKKGFYWVVVLLVENGADVNLKAYGKTPRDAAREKGHNDVVDWLNEYEKERVAAVHDVLDVHGLPDELHDMILNKITLG